MKTIARLCATALVAATMMSGAVVAQEGSYLRKGKQTIVLTMRDGRLFCRRQADGFEMCNGMAPASDGTYRGKNMRHPAMKVMKFNGTVTFTDGGLNIRGCALGICKAENWTKM